MAVRNLLAVLLSGVLLGFIIQDVCYKLYMKPSIGCIESVERQNDNT